MLHERIIKRVSSSIFIKFTSITTNVGLCKFSLNQKKSSTGKSITNML